MCSQYPRGPNEADMQPASSSGSDGPLVLEGELGDRKNWAGRCYSTLCAAVTTVAGTAFGGWRVYCLQPVLPAAFALAMLYLTVMSLGARSFLQVPKKHSFLQHHLSSLGVCVCGFCPMICRVLRTCVMALIGLLSCDRFLRQSKKMLICS